ncbi:hypothetical protein POL68_36850 [Stigmatella sp. ncwal1]|uniref:Lipoprotein n=1 Tax=Stigmatella ashevillensis TaxID=2995309 RepID=A0ABT5DMY1_9BACT|nr:hypothetical protein [Stigmatella ashevillena]MDC0714093.1 hypothetical protein [Stigmatella ashevillena]
MKRSLPGLVLSLCTLFACKEPPPGEMEPIPRPAGYEAPPPPQAEVARPAEAPDPNKVLLRWKLAVDSPIALRLEGTPEKGADAAPAPAKKKGKGAQEAPASEPASSKALNIVYVLQQPETGDILLRVVPSGGPPDTGTVSERGFVLDGLDKTMHTLADLMLELPRERVGLGDKWSLGMDLVDPAPLGPGFATKKSDRRNSVKLTALTPEGDDRVATLEYDLHESVSGVLSPLAGPSRIKLQGHGKSPLGKKKEKDEHEHEKEQEKPTGTPRDVSMVVTVTGRGEFLVKAGRWRAWQGSLSARTEGYTPKSPASATAQLPEGKYALRLTPLEGVPAELKLEALK